MTENEKGKEGLPASEGKPTRAEALAEVRAIKDPYERVRRRAEYIRRGVL